MSTNLSFAATDQKTLRKLPKGWRRANQLYEILMILLSAANIILCVINGNHGIISELYFEIYACIITLVPVAWSKILDTEKKVIDSTTPPDTPSTDTYQLPPCQSNQPPPSSQVDRVSSVLSAQSASTQTTSYVSGVMDPVVFSEMPIVIPQFVDKPICDVNTGVCFVKTQNGQHLVQSTIVKPTPAQLIERGRSMSEITRSVIETVTTQVRSQLSPTNTLKTIPTPTPTLESQESNSKK